MIIIIYCHEFRRYYEVPDQTDLLHESDIPEPITLKEIRREKTAI